MIDISASRPLLVFGGPYSNLPATRAVRAEAERLGIGPQHVICTGDIVAYCAEPEETAQAVRAWGCHAIQGNCEQQLAAGAEDCACNFAADSACAALAKDWYAFANGRLSPEVRAWMGALPATLVVGYAGHTIRVVHGGVAQVNRWVFASQGHVLAEEFALSGTDVVVAGHAGLPFVARVGAGAWFNPGVIGMPANDGTADAWYGLLRPERGRLVLSTHRLPYDARDAASAMHRAGHAAGYATTLVSGLWPSLDVLPFAERAATGRRIEPVAMVLGADSPPQAARAQMHP